MSYDVLKGQTRPLDSTIESWMNNYKEQNIELDYDKAAMSMASPDDSLLVVGPPRLRYATEDGFYVVGFANNFQYNETSQVQPLKALGSRRHLFSRTNNPVTGSIGRMIFYGPNLYRALYAQIDVNAAKGGAKDNTKFSANNDVDDSWYANLEEDLYRIPIGIGIIYRAPKNGNSDSPMLSIGADYIESCQLQNRSIGLQSGQSLVMEQVSFMGDRVIPWKTYKSDITFSTFSSQP